MTDDREAHLQWQIDVGLRSQEGVDRAKELEEVPHSLMGPSSFKRVEECPSSAILGMGLDPSPASEYAAEGSVAHHVLEQCLTSEMEPWEFLGQEFTVGEFTFEVTAEMADFVTDCLRFAKGLAGDHRIEVEIKMEIPGTPVYGYSDLVIFAKPKHIADLKYGAGIMVEADTPQLGLYGLMAILNDEGEAYLFNGPDDEVLVVAHIMQPRGRRQAFRKHEWTRAALIALLARVRKTIDEVAMRKFRYKAGEHCRFCPATAVCPMLRKVAEDAVMAEVVGDPELMMTREELDKAYEMLPALDLWIKRITGMITTYLEKGGTLNSAKLVKKRARREWVNETAAIQWMEQNIDGGAYKSVVLTPPQAEKKTPKDRLKELDEFITKTSTGVTIAPMDDPRHAVKLVAEKGKAALAQQSAKRIMDQARSKKP